MTDWASFERDRPEMAAVLRAQLGWIPIAYLATTRRDGAPRVHPVCPILAADGRMYVAVPATSPKRHDLRGDGRYALHALPGKRDDEFYATGRAILHNDALSRAAAGAAAGHTIHDSDLLFELALETAMTAYWENRGQPGTYAVRTFWRAAR